MRPVKGNEAMGCSDHNCVWGHGGGMGTNGGCDCLMFPASVQAGEMRSINRAVRRLNRVISGYRDAMAEIGARCERAYKAPDPSLPASYSEVMADGIAEILGILEKVESGR